MRARRSTILLHVSFLLLVLLSANAKAGKLTVNSGRAYELQQAVNSTKSHDTLIITAGNYYCNELNIDHPLTILGEGHPVLDGRMKGQVISVHSSSVTIKGLTVMNTGQSDLNDYAAIKVYNASHCLISANRIINAYFGIYLTNVDSSFVTDNIIQGKATVEVTSGNGIHLWKSRHIVIEGNTTTGYRDGIYFEFVRTSIIRNNISMNNIRYGLHFMFSDSDQYLGNRFMQNGAGVAVMYSKFITMKNNVFSHNWGPAAYGLLLKDISYSLIRQNTFDENTVGIYMEGSSNLVIKRNLYRNNGWAMKILANCSGDSLTENNFTGNSFDISTNGNTNENFYYRNYWDNYTGYDLDHNNIGDVPYRPVSMFSMVVEDVPSSVILLRSFMVGILNQAEKTVPVFIPDSIIDNEPAMNMYEAGAAKYQ